MTFACGCIACHTAIDISYPVMIIGIAIVDGRTSGQLYDLGKVDRRGSLGEKSKGDKCVASRMPVSPNEGEESLKASSQLTAGPCVCWNVLQR